MGKLIQGVNGPFIGKVGPAVGYLWKRIPCVRAYRATINYPNTPEQQRERDWFVAMVRFAAQARPALLLGMRQYAAAKSMTEGNFFVTRNKEHFQRTDEGIMVDYARLRIAQGPAADVVFHSPVFREHEVISVDFDKNTLFSRSSGDDKVYVYAYAPELGRGKLSAPADRKERNIKIMLPETWNGTTVHLYGFVVDREGRSSDSTYIGAGRLDHYSEGANYVHINKSWMDFVEVANRINTETQSRQTSGDSTPMPEKVAGESSPVQRDGPPR